MLFSEEFEKTRFGKVGSNKNVVVKSDNCWSFGLRIPRHRFDGNGVEVETETGLWNSASTLLFVELEIRG